MKRFFIISLSFSLLFTCSSSDDEINNNISEDYFFRAQIDGLNFDEDIPDGGGLGNWENCYSWYSYDELVFDLDGDGIPDGSGLFFDFPITEDEFTLLQGSLLSNNLGEIDSSGYFINLYMFHYENEENHLSALGLPWSESTEDMFSNVSLFDREVDFQCYNAFLFIIEIVNGNDSFSLIDGSSTGNISVPVLVNEQISEVEYAFSGEFTANFLNNSGEVIEFSCQFRSPIFMSK